MRIAKVTATILITVFLIFFCAETVLSKEVDGKADIITGLFKHYNPKLSALQAQELSSLVIQAGEKFALDPFLLAAIIVRESSARPWAISKGGDYGLMQVRWHVHKEQIKKKYPQAREAADLLRPEINIFVGAEIFARYYAQKKTIHGGLLRYSAGNTTLAKRVLRTLSELDRKHQEAKK